MSTYAQYLFDSGRQPAVKTSIVRPLREQLQLRAPDDWNPDIFWMYVQSRFKRFPHQSFMLLICSKFLRQRSCGGQTPAMYLSHYLSLTVRHIALSLFSSAPQSASNPQCTEGGCSDLF